MPTRRAPMVRAWLLGCLLAAAGAGPAQAEFPLFRISTADTRITEYALSMEEIRRAPRVSEVRVAEFHRRDQRARRWMMCMFNTLAVLRGFEYWTVVYPQPGSDVVLVGFPRSMTEDLAAFDPRFDTRRALGIIAPIERGVRLCKDLRPQSN
ncbi:MAG: hypothetical protein JSW68_01700 [Burkholderiales bacterium]|nr:MAG: hypothetical protein JSW68_01700 [Burkholderiales bacterium]